MELWHKDGLVHRIDCEYSQHIFMDVERDDSIKIPFGLLAEDAADEQCEAMLSLIMLQANRAFVFGQKVGRDNLKDSFKRLFDI